MLVASYCRCVSLLSAVANRTLRSVANFVNAAPTLCLSARFGCKSRCVASITPKASATFTWTLMFCPSLLRSCADVPACAHWHAACVTVAMRSGTAFLIAARQCEIHELQQLMRTSTLVRRAGECVHALQRERGLSNLWLGAGDEFGGALRAQVDATRACETRLREAFDGLDTSAGRIGNGARLYSRIAYALQGLDALPGLRAEVTARRITADLGTRAFIKLIAALLTVVFEAADSATDPGISRRLVAMFHFLQGKELAGQERATGAAAFTSGRLDAAAHQHWLHLIDSQERCFAVFVDFSAENAAAVSRWHAVESDARAGAFAQLRVLAIDAEPEARLPASRSRDWFEACTARIDGMHEVEAALANELLALCGERIAEAEADLAVRAALLNDTTGVPAGAFFDAAPGASATPTLPIGPQLERSVLDMVQEQSRRLQSMGDELEAVRATLSERKVVERAKGLLMAHRRLSEAEAHKMLRQTAMNQNRRLIDVAESVLAMSDFLAPTPPSPPR